MNTQKTSLSTMDFNMNGNFIILKKGCTYCGRTTNKISEYTSTVTGESYKIDGHYTCKSSNCICHSYLGKL